MTIPITVRNTIAKRHPDAPWRTGLRFEYAPLRLNSSLLDTIGRNPFNGYPRTGSNMTQRKPAHIRIHSVRDGSQGTAVKTLDSDTASSGSTPASHP